MQDLYAESTDPSTGKILLNDGIGAAVFLFFFALQGSRLEDLYTTPIFFLFFFLDKN